MIIALNSFFAKDIAQRLHPAGLSSIPSTSEPINQSINQSVPSSYFPCFACFFLFPFFWPQGRENIVRKITGKHSIYSAHGIYWVIVLWGPCSIAKERARLWDLHTGVSAPQAQHDLSEPFPSSPVWMHVLLILIFLVILTCPWLWAQPWPDVP